MLSFDELKLSLEAVLFAADASLTTNELRELMGDVSLTDVKTALKDLSRDYQNRAFELHEDAEKWQLRTKAAFKPLLNRQYAAKARSLSKSSLETLAIIAYQQPVTRAQVNAIRGVDSASIISALKEKELVYVSGKRNEVGHPLEFKTTNKFLEVFGLASLKELPSLRSLQMNQDQALLVKEALSPQDEVVPTPSELSMPDRVVEGAEVAEWQE